MIEPCTIADYHEILRNLGGFWGSDRTRSFHHPMFVREFGDSAFVAREGGVLAAYLFGFCSQREPVGYVHLAAVREGYRRRGLAAGLYRHFAGFARGRGCREVRAITTPGNAGSIAFHTAIAMRMSGEPNAEGVPVVASYAGPGEDRVVFRMAIAPEDPGASGLAPGPYLRATPVIDWDHPAVSARARALSGGDPVSVARRCFEWVRDEIRHSFDHGLAPVTCKASEVLEAGSGLCYAKSHLLAALLRANALPAGFCYQRLGLDEDGATFCLHGLVAVQLPGVGWYRADPRGNRADVDAQFTPPVERLAFPIRLEGEADLPEIWPDPLPAVVEALHSCRDASELPDRLPDLPLVRPRPGGGPRP